MCYFRGASIWETLPIDWWVIWPVAFSTCNVSNPKIHQKIPAGNPVCTRVLRTLPTQMTKCICFVPCWQTTLAPSSMHSDARRKGNISTYLGKILGHSAVEIHRREGRAAPSAHASVDVRHGGMVMKKENN